jgi:hypothetical protein
MGSLFLASVMLIKNNCKFKISDKREKIFGLGNNTWLVYSEGTIATNHVCPKARSSSPLTISSGQAVTVQPGCHIPTMDHIITVDDTNKLEIHSTWLDWNLSQLFDYNDSEQITKIVNELRSKITGEFDSSKSLQKLDELYKAFQSIPWLFSSQAAMIGSLIIVSFISFALWKKCCAKSSPETPVMPSLSAPVAPAPSAVSLQLASLNFNKSPAPKSIMIINS